MASFFPHMVTLFYNMRILASLFPLNLPSLNLYQLHLYIVKGVKYILSCRDTKISLVHRLVLQVNK